MRTNVKASIAAGLLVAAVILAGGASAAPSLGSVSANAASAASPEPLTVGLLGMLLAGFGVLRRRRA